MCVVREQPEQKKDEQERHRPTRLQANSMAPPPHQEALGRSWGGSYSTTGRRVGGEKEGRGSPTPAGRPSSGRLPLLECSAPNLPLAAFFSSVRPPHKGPFLRPRYQGAPTSPTPTLPLLPDSWSASLSNTSSPARSWLMSLFTAGPGMGWGVCSAHLLLFGSQRSSHKVLRATCRMDKRNNVVFHGPHEKGLCKPSQALPRRASSILRTRQASFCSRLSGHTAATPGPVFLLPSTRFPGSPPPSLPSFCGGAFERGRQAWTAARTLGPTH